MEMTNIYDLARQCQYVDEKFIKCGRRASWEIDEGLCAAPLRCDEHAIKVAEKKTGYAFTHTYNKYDSLF